ncbi:MAG: hypothetical protein WD824_19160 [Cyclobacteriaceae bacterium]
MKLSKHLNVSDFEHYIDHYLERTADKGLAKIRPMITGNVLQAFGAYKGKLLSYPTIDAGIKKGILMPEYWEPGNDVQQKNIVPVSRAIKIIRSLTPGSSITTKNNVSIFRQPGGFKIMVSSARSSGGDIYLGPDLLEVVDKNNFKKISDKMTATLYFNLPVTTLDDHIWTLMDLGIGGYVAGRSLEKISENLGPVLYNMKRKT